MRQGQKSDRTVIAAALSGFVLAATRGRVSTLLNGYSLGHRRWERGAPTSYGPGDATMAISPIGGVDTGAGRRVGSATPATDGISFADSLGALLEDVEEKGQQANVAVTNMLSKTGEVHDAMIALHEAEEALELTIAFRNKFVQAYQEIMRMGI